MLRILGSARKLCGGMTRRDLLRIGGLGLAGMTMSDLARWQAASGSESARAKSFGRAKSIILIHLYGSPSQIEWVDPKPDAPLEVRGDLGSIPSSLPGLHVCELLPKFAQVMDRTTVLRSMTHPYPLHGVAFALTGVPTLDLPAELNPRDPRNWPFFGSVVDYVESLRERSGEAPRRAVPANMALPFRFSSRRIGEVPRAGPYATFLGAEYDPVWTDYVGTATKGLAKTLADKRFDENDPYIGLSPESYFYVPAATNLPGDVTLDRLRQRKSLAAQLDEARQDLAASSRGRQLDRYRRMTYELLESNQLRDALDLRKEPATTRELYGHTLFGQSCLAARRLVEAGIRIVSVFWDEYGLAGSGWDTHYNHYPRMKQELCPGLDQGWYGLITDLDRRGLLDETLVVCTSEHGRTPKITTGQGGGRDHWSRVYSTLLAGGGTKRGQVIGASDKQGGDVLERPISPKDLLATMYHLLGIDHQMIVHDTLDRPLPLVDGEVIHEAIA
jgi:uncharacterized protein (DUF1501 family)